MLALIVKNFNSNLPLSEMSSGHGVQLVQTIPESIRPAIALLPVIPEATTTEETHDQTNDMVKFTTHSIILRSLYRFNNDNENSNKEDPFEYCLKNLPSYI